MNQRGDEVPEPGAELGIPRSRPRKTLYFAAGSGIPEIKTILSGTNISLLTSVMIRLTDALEAVVYRLRHSRLPWYVDAGSQIRWSIPSSRIRTFTRQGTFSSLLLSHVFPLLM